MNCNLLENCIPAIAFLLVTAAAAEATTWYVAPTGNDSAAGRAPATAFATVQKAVDMANPGDTIRLADGVYFQDVVIGVEDSGEANAPILITGGPAAIIKGNGDSRIVEINGDYLTLDGFTIDGEYAPGLYRDKLIYATGTVGGDGVVGLRILHMTLQNAGGECVRLRYFSQQNEIAYNTITSCGQYDFGGIVGCKTDGDKNGEGVYIGTAVNQRGIGNLPDPSNANWVHHNTINTQGNECVDIKEGAFYNIVEDNDCTGQKDDDSAGFDSRSDWNIFRRNQSYNNCGAGIRFGGHTIALSDAPDFGRTYGINNDAYDNDIHDNLKGGIKFMQKPQSRICGNTMANNTGGNSVGTYKNDFHPTDPCPSTTVISEDFFSSAASLQFSPILGGTWKVSGKQYKLTNPATSGSGLHNWNISVHNTSVTGDFILTAKAKVKGSSSPWDDFSILFNFTDSNNYAYVSFNEQNDGNTSGIFRVVNGMQEELVDIPTPIKANKWYEITIERFGDTVKVWRDGVLMATATEASFSSGKVGFGSRNNSCFFDNLVVNQ